MKTQAEIVGNVYLVNISEGKPVFDKEVQLVLYIHTVYTKVYGIHTVYLD